VGEAQSTCQVLQAAILGRFRDEGPAQARLLHRLVRYEQQGRYSGRCQQNLSTITPAMKLTSARLPSSTPAGAGGAVQRSRVAALDRRAPGRYSSTT
jgi:hypothetical protein